MRKMVYVQKILDINPIPNADNIEVVTIGGWKVVSKKGEFTIGDKCAYFEIDSILPKATWSDFLGDRLRLRTIKLRKQISQGLALPLATVGVCEDLPFNTDLTEQLGVEKYVEKIPANLAGIAKGPFPSFLTKTDEERCQNLSAEISEWQGVFLEVSEKVDGASTTYYKYENNFGVCSRNLELLENPDNGLWKMATKYNLKDIPNSICLQGEICGPGVQSNPLQLPELDLFIFNVINLETGEKYSANKLMEFCTRYSLKHVPYIYHNLKLNHRIEELLTLAEGKSVLGNVEREGLVFRSKDCSISFKAISNKFLFKQDSKKKKKHDKK